MRLEDAQIDDVVYISAKSPVRILSFEGDKVQLYDYGQNFCPPSLREFTRARTEWCEPCPSYADYMVSQLEFWMGRMTVPEKQKVLDKYEGIDFPHRREDDAHAEE